MSNTLPDHDRDLLARDRERHVRALVCKGSLTSCHTGSLNALSFSLDEKYLASCGEDRRVAVIRIGHDTSGPTSAFFRGYEGSFEVLSLAWHPVRPMTLITGSANGDVNVVSFNRHSKDNDDERLIHSFRGRVNVLAFTRDGNTLAIAVGNQVAVVHGDIFEQESWTSITYLSFPVHKDGNSDVEGIHFMEDGTLVVLFYLQPSEILAFSTTTEYCEEVWRICRRRDTVIGGSALSPNGQLLAVTNVCDGIDWYSLESEYRCYISTTTYDLGISRFSTNLTFINHTTIVVGNGDGSVFLMHYSEKPRDCGVGTQLGGRAGKVIQHLAVCRGLQDHLCVVVSASSNPPVLGIATHLVMLTEIPPSSKPIQQQRAQQAASSLDAQDSTTRVVPVSDLAPEMKVQASVHGMNPEPAPELEQRDDVGSSMMQTVVFGILGTVAIIGFAGTYLLPLSIPTFATFSQIKLSPALINMQNFRPDFEPLYRVTPNIFSESRSGVFASDTDPMAPLNLDVIQVTVTQTLQAPTVTRTVTVTEYGIPPTASIESSSICQVKSV